MDAAPSRSQAAAVVDQATALFIVISLGGACAIACTTGDASTPAGLATSGDAPNGATVTTTPTWYRDIEPIVQVECAGCHTVTGPGAFVLDRFTTTSLASLVAERVSARDMPPWPPSRGGPPLAGARMLDDDAIATIAAWATAGSPEGDPRDHVDRAPRVGHAPPEAPDVHLELAAGESYRHPSNVFVTDEVRCFVLDLPPNVAGAWVKAARWKASAPIGVRALGGVALDATAARAAHRLERTDGRAGFECGGGFGEATASASITWLGASGSGAPTDGATLLPSGSAVRIAAGGAVLMRVHYAVKHLGSASDRPAVDLWLTQDGERRSVRPLIGAAIAAPVEVPCPGGVSRDPSNACSRDNAFARLAPADPAGARARADARLAECGTTLEAANAAGAVAGGASAPHYEVSTSCTRALPWDGTIRVVHARMQTRGARVLLEAERSDGSWSAVLDIPRWRWAWESAYVLDQGITVAAGRHLRVSCTFDNGLANQWSALTGEAGHDGPARPPVLPPGYLISAPNRAAEACEAEVGIERAPYRNAAWPTLCHEAEAVHGDACGGAIDLTSRGCSPTDEDASVAILALSPEALQTTCAR